MCPPDTSSASFCSPPRLVKLHFVALVAALILGIHSHLASLWNSLVLYIAAQPLCQLWIPAPQQSSPGWCFGQLGEKLPNGAEVYEDVSADEPGWHLYGGDLMPLSVNVAVIIITLPPGLSSSWLWTVLSLLLAASPASVSCLSRNLSLCSK